MATTNSISRSLQAVTSSAISSSSRPAMQCMRPSITRSMATHTDSHLLRNAGNFQPPSATSVLTTIYDFPTMEPLRIEKYPASYLHLPLRRDILHRAIVFEGDATRQGTASTKTRYEVHGSHRKMRRQKGSGMARVGTRQSPIMKGGGKVFGPKPRDFSTDLPRKMYDLAWRTALSMRYRRGELLICENGMDLEYAKSQFAKSVFAENEWGNEHGRSLIITSSHRQKLFTSLKDVRDEGRVLTMDNVDVKDLLELGRVIIEKSALDSILHAHKTDLAGQEVPNLGEADFNDLSLGDLNLDGLKI